MKYGREIAAVELHAFDDFEFGLGGLGFLDRDDALIADLLHRLGEEAADLGVAIGRDRADLGDLVIVGDLAGVGLQFGDDGFDGLVDAALQIHRVHAGGDRLGAFLDDRLGENGRGRGAVAGDVAGLRGHLAHHLRAHVLELVLELDFLGDGDAVLGDARRAEGLVDDDVAALGAERHLHRVGEDVDAAQHLLARVGMEFDFLGSHWIYSFVRQHFVDWLVSGRRRSGGLLQSAVVSITPITSLSFMISRSSPSSLISVPDHLPNRMRSPTFTSSG